MDLLTIPIILFIVAVVVIFGFMLLSAWNTVFIASSVATAESTAVLTAGLNALLFWDQLNIFLIGAMYVGVLIMASQINAHPVFFVGSVLVLLLLLFVGTMTANVFLEIMAQSSIASFANQFPFTVLFFQNIGVWLLVMTVGVVLVSYTLGGRRGGDANVQF